MAIIGDLFVRVRADTSDVTTKMKGLGQSMGSVGTAALRLEKGFISFGRSSSGAKLSVNTLTATVTSLASQVTNVNPGVARLTSLLGSLAVGAPVVAGAIAGLTAIAALYDRLTSGARAAAEQQRKLTQALSEQFAPKTGPQSETAKNYQNALDQQADALRHLKILQSSSNDLEVAAKFIAAGEAVPFKKRADLIDEYTESLRQANQAIYRAQAGSVTSLETVTIKGRDMVKVTADAFQKFIENSRSALAVFDSLARTSQSSKPVNDALAAAYDAVQKKLLEIGDNASVARSQLLALADALRANIAVSQHIATMNSVGSVGPLVGKTLPSATLAGSNAFQDVVSGFRGHMAPVNNPDAQKFMKGLIDAANNDPVIAAEKKNTEALQTTIANTAAQTASIIGSALVSFGSSRGNQIGGALGGSIGGGIGAYIGHQLTTEGGKFIGGALGSAVGSVIPVVGTLVGGFLGSAIGGLFGHHKKAVDANTQALNANTKVMSQLLNEPSGFKVNRYRYDASEVMGAITRAAIKHQARGGPMPWSVAPGR